MPAHPILNRIRIWILIAGFSLSLFLLLGRSFYLQFIDNEKLQTESEKRILRIKNEIHPRGNILDRNGTVLAIDNLEYIVGFDSETFHTKCKQCFKADALSLQKSSRGTQQFIKILSKAISIEPEVLFEKIQKHLKHTQTSTKNRYKTLGKISNIFDYTQYEIDKENTLSHIGEAQKKDELQTAIQNIKKDFLVYIKSTVIDKNYRRYYPQREAFSHLIGYHRRNGDTSIGIEKWQNTALAGSPSQERHLQQIDGKVVEIKKITPGKIGENIQLSVDSQMQYFLNRSLHKHLKIQNASRAYGLLVEIPSGLIRAMAAQPNFNPNAPITKDSQLRFYPLSSRLEGGSTQKPLLVAAGLESGDITENTTVSISNRFQKGDFTLLENRKLGVRTVTEVIQHSLTTGIVQLAQKVHPKHLFNLYEKLEYTKDSENYNLLTGELLGVSVLKNWRSWSDGNYFSRSYGYTQAISMRDLISFYIAIANDGILPPIRMLNEPTETNHAQNKQIISKENSQIIKKMLHQVVLSGSGRNAKVPGYSVAGKTGTAQKIKQKNGVITDILYTTIFVGFAPVEQPKFVLAIVIDEPKASEEFYTGGKVAAPVFSEVMGHVLRLDIEN